MAELVPGHDPLPTTEDDDDVEYVIPDTPEHWTDAQNTTYTRMFNAIYENERVLDALPAWSYMAYIIGSIAAEMLDPNSKDIMFYDHDTGAVIGQIVMQERTLS